MTRNFSLNLSGRLLRLDRPRIMGILNATPDSFFALSRAEGGEEACRRAETLVREGADIIDVGAYSTRPGGEEVTLEEEMRRMETALQAVRRAVGDFPVSVDTFRLEVAQMAVQKYSAAIVNDIAGGGGKVLFGAASKSSGTASKAGFSAEKPCENGAGEASEMFQFIARSGVGYVLMSAESTVDGVLQDLLIKSQTLLALGAKDIILDPGFGFGKTVDENFLLLSQLSRLKALDLPLLVGLSRKSMLYKPLNISALEALNATTAAHVIAIERGADILRVHDVRAAQEAVRVVELSCGF